MPILGVKGLVPLFTVPKFSISQPEALPTVLISNSETLN